MLPGFIENLQPQANECMIQLVLYISQDDRGVDIPPVSGGKMLCTGGESEESSSVGRQRFRWKTTPPIQCWNLRWQLVHRFIAFEIHCIARLMRPSLVWMADLLAAGPFSYHGRFSCCRPDAPSRLYVPLFSVPDPRHLLRGNLVFESPYPLRKLGVNDGQ